MNKLPSYSSTSSISLSPIDNSQSTPNKSSLNKQQRSKIKTNGHLLIKSQSTSSFSSFKSNKIPHNLRIDDKKHQKLSISPYISNLIEINDTKIERKLILNQLKTFTNQHDTQICILVGSNGSGKTSIIEQLIKNSKIYNENLKESELISDDKLLGAYLCRSDNIDTLRSDLFINNLITSMFNHSSKLFQNYKNYLLNSNLLETYLFNETLIKHKPDLVVEKLIIEPLNYLYKLKEEYNDDCYLILIDSIDICFNEQLNIQLSETSDGDFGINNLARLILFNFNNLFTKLYPKFKFLLTCRKSGLNLINNYLNRNQIDSFKYSLIDIDSQDSYDSNEYIKYRLSLDGESNRIKKNLYAFNLNSVSSNSSFSDYSEVASLKEKLQIERKFIQFLMDKCEANFLYLKFLLDLIEDNCLIIKSLNFNNLPKSLDEVLQLKFNLVFKSTSNSLLSILVYSLAASFYKPLSVDELYELVNHNAKIQLDWNEFSSQIDLLVSHKLIQFNYKLVDDTNVVVAYVQFNNLTFKDWLWSYLKENKPNLLNNAHYLLAGKLFTKISKKELTDNESIVKFLIHLRLSNLFDSKNPKFYAYFFSMLNLDKSLIESLILDSSLLTLLPNSYLINIIILNGVNIFTLNHQIDSQIYPLIQLFACYNYKQLLCFINSLTIISNNLAYRLLISATEFGAYETCLYLIDSFNLNLLTSIPSSNWCVPLFAAKNNYLNLMSYYLSLINEDKTDLIRQLCVVSCIYDRYECFCYLIDTEEFNVNESDTLFGETPLTASCSYGRKSMCEYLFEKTNVCINQLNKKQLSPLLCAIKSNEWQMVEYLLTLEGIDIELCDKHSRSALIIASSEGHLAIIDILIEKQADLNLKDCDGLTALSWACLKGNYNAAITLVENGADIHHEDDSGRSTLDLATFSGDFRLVQFLVDHNAQLEHSDHIGMKPLDRAISCGYNEIVLYYLNKGAKLSNATWTVASDKLDIIFLLLNKLIEDGNRFYKKNQYQDALYRYTYAFKKFPSLNLATNDSDTDKLNLIQFNLYLNLGRTYRKIGDYQNSIDHCTKALEQNPVSFEAFYTRARAKRDFHMFETALSDLYEAQHLNPTNLDVKKLISKVIADIKKKSNQKSSPSSQSSLCTYFSSRNETNI